MSVLCLHSPTSPVGTSAAALEPEGHGQQVQLPQYDSAQDPVVRHCSTTVSPAASDIVICSINIPEAGCCRRSYMSVQER